MKKTKFLRVAAFTLALIFVFAGGSVAMSANDGSSDSISDATTSDIQELLNAMSYSEYIANETETERATENVVISAVENWEYTLKNGSKPSEGGDVAKVTDEYGKEGLYVPSTGTVTWTSDKFTTEKKYYVVIEYYPVVNKAASIERVFLVNGKIPFAEARQMSMDKTWVTSEPYAEFVISDGKVTIGSKKDAVTKTVSEWISDAATHGITASQQVKKIGGKDTDILRFEMPMVWNADNIEYVDSVGLRFFASDIDKNEIRSGLTDAPEWSTYYFKDASGYMTTPFEVVMGPGEDGAPTTFSLRSVNEPIVISEIRFEAPEENITYAEYKAQYSNAPAGTDVLKIEAEFFGNTSSQTIYPISDNTSAVTSPAATDRTLLNTVGGDKWQSAGQWIEYSFTVGSTGMYQIVPRFKQNLLDGMYTSRSLHIYSSDGKYDGIPFEEAGRLKFDYSSEWQAGPISDGGDPFEFYFEKGVTYTIRFEVSLGKMGDIVRQVQESLNAINDDYLNILKLTGPTPDEYRDYGFKRVMPDTMDDMKHQAGVLYAVAATLEAEADVKSSNTATLEKVARLLEQMGTDEDEIAPNLEQLKTYIGSLGTWLSDAKTQPLVLDYINIQPASAELPRAKANFFQSIWYEIVGFFQSFARNYDRMGAMTEISEEETVEVWLAYGRDQAQVIRGLINNDFTYNTGIPVNLKLVSGGTLLPSILAGKGPDVYIGLGQGDVINYAIRGALISIDDIPEHEEYKGNADKFIADFGQTPDEFYAEYADSRADFNEAAMMVLEIVNEFGVNHCYGLPETQNFNMMFVREDILAELDIEIPKTWDDVKAAIPVLQANNMQIGMHNDVKIFLYQNGGELFADDGMRINLDSNVALDSFNTMCDFFTMYSFPYKYDFANRFRTGEMPIGFAAYTATYNQLKVFATEIEGLWSFYPMPGVMDSEGNINNASVSSASAIVMITGCDLKHDAWEFMRWHVDDRCQIDYSNEMVAILGPSAKHATANESALKSMPWTVEELEQLEFQFNNLASIPNYPGNYIVDRYLKFAFLDAYDKNLDPAKSLESYVVTINKEIARKRQEFRLEILDFEEDQPWPTLASKRLRQAHVAMEEAGFDADGADLYKNIERFIRGTTNAELKCGYNYDVEDYGSLREYCNQLEEYAKSKNTTKYDTAIQYMREAASALEVYENYK